MSDSAGRIDLDLAINQKGFDKQLNGIMGVAKKAGVALAAAFGVKKLANFGKECLELGSDLAEVQNVVDVTFPRMAAQVDQFAKSAAATFGLSETMAKKFTGTFGAMSRAFGFSEAAAYEMSSTLTGLAGDVASFYNIEQDLAYTKLKSVFSGETETLKDLGIVMTQTALDAYAMANGYGKVTKNMSEAEKVSLRYAFVQDKLRFAIGDFARTSDSWANQTRILKLQFDSLKASLGQGFINILSPVVKALNALIAKLVVAANAFKSFTELVTGNKAAEGASQGLEGAAGAAEGLAESTTAAGEAAKKTAKAMKALMGFDKINKLDDKSDDSDKSNSGPADSGMDLGKLAEGDTVVDKTSKSLDKLITKAKELAKLFKKGFQIGFGDSAKNIGTIKKSIKSIGSSLRGIFTSKEVVGAASLWADSVATNLGKVTGSVAKVGIAVATNLTGGIAKSLEEKKDFITKKLASILTISAEAWNVSGDFAVALGDIISGVLTSNPAIDITADVFSMLTTGFLGGAELFAKAGLDLAKLLTQPIIDNKDKIEEAITNTLEPVSQVVDTLKTAVEDSFEVFTEVYDEHVSPFFTALREGTSDSFGKLLDCYNQYVAPVLSNLATKFNEVYQKHLKPVIEKVGGLLGNIADSLKELYLVRVKPFVDWCIKTIIPILAPVFETLGTTVLNVLGAMGDVVGGIIDALSGLVTFITGVLTGNWEKAWKGIRDIFSGVIDAIKGIWSGIKSVFSGALEAIKKLFSPIGGWFKARFREAYSGVTNIFKGIGGWFKERYTAVTNAFNGVGSWFKGKFKAAYTGVKDAFSGIGDWFKERYEAVTGKFANVSSWFGKKFRNAWRNIKKEFSEVGEFFGGIWDTIKEKFTTIGTKIGDVVGGAFRTVINAVLDAAENVLNAPIKAINKLLGTINKVLPVNIDELKTFDLPRIEKLAQGGYVRKNTPQLAVIGDNRHQGEVVAPEDKLTEMALNAAKMAGGGSGNGEVIALLKQILKAIEGLELDLIMDGESVKKKVVKRIRTETRSKGKNPVIM